MAEEKKTLSAKQVVADIRAGATDEFLMKKYGVSERGLQSLFQKLITANILTQADLDRRTSAVDEVEAVIIESEAEPVPSTPVSNQSKTREDQMSREQVGGKSQDIVTNEEALRQPAGTIQDGHHPAMAQAGATLAGTSNGQKYIEAEIDENPRHPGPFAVVAIVICFVFFWNLANPRSPVVVGLCLGIAALVLSIMSGYKYARFKGYDPGWGLLAGITAPIGLIVFMLRDFTGDALNRRRAIELQAEIRQQDVIRGLVEPITYEEIATTFLGTEQTMTSAQRAQEWKKYVNRWVNWSGEVVDVSQSSTYIAVKMDNGNYLTLYICETAKNKAAALNKGEKISFVGKVSTSTQNGRRVLTLKDAFM